MSNATTPLEIKDISAGQPVDKFEIRDYLRLDMFPHFLCPGCGHGIALRALLWAIHDLDIDKNQLAVVSGIGCSGRLSAYIDANTFHTTHGRPLAFAAGLKLARPDLHYHLHHDEQRGLRHDRRAGISHHQPRPFYNHDTHGQPGTGF